MLQKEFFRSLKRCVVVTSTKFDSLLTSSWLFVFNCSQTKFEAVTFLLVVSFNESFLKTSRRIIFSSALVCKCTPIIKVAKKE